MGRAKTSAEGTPTASAWPPGSSGVVPNTDIAPLAHRAGSPAVQGRQRPHPTIPETSTRSPTPIVRTPGPASVTVPMNS